MDNLARRLLESVKGADWAGIAATPGHVIRYGVTPARRQAMELGGEIEGMPPVGTPEAERYASNFLAAKHGRPQWAASLFNRLALSDIERDPEEAQRIKHQGDLGFAAGRRKRSRAAQLLAGALQESQWTSEPEP